MTTQTVKLASHPGQIGTTMQLWSIDTLLLVQSVPAIETVWMSGLYTADFVDAPAASYRVLHYGPDGDLLWSSCIVLTLTTATFQAHDAALASGGGGGGGDATLANQVIIKADLDDIQTRLPAALTAAGNMKSSLLEIITTALTEGAVGRIAAAWQGFWNVATPTGNVNSLPSAIPGNSAGLPRVSDVPTTAQMEAAILNEGDATALLAAIAAKVEAFLINEGDATATIAAIATACNAAVAAGAVGTNAATAATQSTTAATQATTAATQSTAAAATATAINTKLGTPAGASVSADIAAVKSDTGTILSRVTATVATLWANLVAMISGSGGTAAFTTTALANAPAGGGGGGGTDWDATERAQIRYRLGLNGTATAPTEPVPDPIVITPGGTDATTGWLVTRDNDGVAEAAVTVRVQMVDEPDSDTGSGYNSGIRAVVSNGIGLAEFAMVRGARYHVWRGDKSSNSVLVVTVPTGAGATYELPSLIGTP